MFDTKEKRPNFNVSHIFLETKLEHCAHYARSNNYYYHYTNKPFRFPSERDSLGEGGL